jgi:hypothetical protein
MGRLHVIANFLSLSMSYFFEGLDANQSAGLRSAEMKAIDVDFKTKEGVRVAAALSRIHVWAYVVESPSYSKRLLLATMRKGHSPLIVGLHNQ